MPQAPGIVYGRGYEVGVIFLFSSKKDMFGPVKSRMCVFPDTFSTSDGGPKNSKSGKVDVNQGFDLEVRFESLVLM